MADSILFIGPQRPVMETLRPLWQELGFEEHHFTATSAALGVLQDGSPPVAILISYPLWDADLDEVIARLDRTLGRQRCALKVVLAPREALAELSALELSAVSVLLDDADPSELQTAVKKLLDRPQRAHPRFIVRLTVQVGSGQVLRACQSENLSISGMLIRTSEDFPVGSSLSLEFVLPEHDQPIRCQAEVVRYTRPDVEELRGMGVRFLAFSDDGRERLRAFLC